MKEIHLRRHAHKNIDGMLSSEGIRSAQNLSPRLERFAKVIASNIPRAQHTAKILTGTDPLIDERASYTEISPEAVVAIESLAQQHKLPFFEAAGKYEDSAVVVGMESKANELNELIDELLSSIDEGQKVLIISHDITIVPAMIKRGLVLQTVNPLEGYVLRSDGSIDRLYA